MKKLIAISVVFALVAGTAFAVDLGGEVIGTVNVLEGNSVKDSKVNSSASMDRVRIQGEAANDDGTFGGWFRAQSDGGNDHMIALDNGGFSTFVSGHAWWKPIDQLKLWVGSNGGDGFFGKEGNTGWMFYQRASDVGVTLGGANVWGWSDYTTGFDNKWSGPGYLITRSAFYGGGIDGANAFYATISPADIVDINLEIPFFNGGEVADVIADLIAQVSFNLDFGNIALTYAGDHSDNTNGDAYVYFNLGAVENLSLDVGIGLTIPGDIEGQPIAAGLGVKYDVNDAFGLKARVTASFAGDDEIFAVLGDILPYFTVSDNLKVFASLGLTMLSPSEGDALIGFHVNPYVWVGQEWGPCFWAGLKIYGKNAPANTYAGGPDESLVNWSVPIAFGVSF